MFTPEERGRLRAHLLEKAAADSRISGAALTGSAAAQVEDKWSDIDLAFGIGNAHELKEVLSDWTALMYREHVALHHVDVLSGTWTYRVFFLSNTLQVDLAFAPADDFRALAPTFRLVSGRAVEPRHSLPPAGSQLIGMAWLYALHARSSIARSKLWQAEYMVSGVRDHTLALACLRHGLPTAYARGMDLLPSEVTEQFDNSMVRCLERAELWRAFSVVIDCLLREMHIADSELAERLQVVLTSLKKDSQ